MLSNQGGRSFLVYERDGVVSDRLRQMVRAEGGSTCIVDSAQMFHELRERLAFDVFVVGVEGPRDLHELKLTPEIEPLILLVPPRGRSAHYSVALPGARILDRRLRDPDALHGLAAGEGRAEFEPDAADPVRQAFAPFGLSERQLEVLRRALLGESGAEIAAKLFISELTVRNHLHAIYERVGVSGRRELMGRFVGGLVASAGHPLG